MSFTAPSAFADGGAGGHSGNVPVAGGAGGVGFNGAAGTDGVGSPTLSAGSGGGGGGAAGGGAGGAGGQTQNVVPAPGVTTPGQNGANGTNDTSFPSGGGGGAGGANGANVTAPTSVSTNLTGQKGGDGGNGGNSNTATAGGGGGGGGGGYGAIVTGPGTVTNTFTITGGAGGNGGNAGTSPFGLPAGGNGGDGGVGLQGTGTGTINNSGTISGGNGGSGGVGTGGGPSGTAGAGGAGVVGSNLTIINSGSITGGLANGGAGARANAITFSGGTNVLELRAGSAITGNVVAFSNLDTFRLGGTANASFDASTIGAAAQVRGFGVFEKTGTSTWTLNNATTAATAWSINAGTLKATSSTPGTSSSVGTGTVTFNGGTFQAGAANLTFSNTFQFNAGGGTIDTGGNALTLTGAMTGTGGMSTSGAQFITLTGALSYAGLTSVGNEGVVLGDATHAVTLPGNANVAAGSILTVENGSLGAGVVTNLGQINFSLLNVGTGSAGSATISNSGIINFLNGSTAGSATITNVDISPNPGQSTLQFFGTSSAGSATIITSNNSTTFFSDTSSGASSRQIVNAGGGLDFTLLTSGGTTIGSLEGAGLVALGNNNLTIGGNNLSTTFSGTIQNVSINLGNPVTGNGGIVKAGTGTLTLSGTNTYTGATTVNAGTLSVNGSIATSSLTTVNAGGTLGGNGTVGNTTINGGTLSPGNSIGTLTVQGNLVLTAASSYLVEVSPANADRTNVVAGNGNLGSATLGGATVNASFAAGTYVVKRYTIVNAAGGVIGTFSGPVNTNLPAGFTSTLSYDANNAYLNLALAFVAPPGTGLSINQQNVGNAIVGFFNTNGGIPIAFGGLTPAGLSQLSGEIATGSQQATFDAMDMFMGLMTDPFLAGRGDAAGASGSPIGYADETLAYAAKRNPNDALAAIYNKAQARTFEQRWNVWAAGFGGSQRTDGNAVVGSNEARSNIYGGAVGADYRFSPDTLAGFAMAGGGTNFSVNGLGSGRSDLFQAGAFFRHNVGPSYLTGALAYGWQDITTDRTVTVAGIDRLRAQFNANAWSGRLEGGYRFVSQGLGWTPYAAGQFVTFALPSYAEQAVIGSNQFALAYNARSVTDTRSELGLRMDKAFGLNDGIMTLRGRIAWAHSFNPDRAIGATFQTLPGASFVVNGAAMAADAALVTAAVEKKWLTGWSAAATFEGEFSSVTRSYAGKGVARYAW